MSKVTFLGRSLDRDRASQFFACLFIYLKLNKISKCALFAWAHWSGYFLGTNLIWVYQNGRTIFGASFRDPTHVNYLHCTAKSWLPKLYLCINGIVLELMWKWPSWKFMLMAVKNKIHSQMNKPTLAQRLRSLTGRQILQQQQEQQQQQQVTVKKAFCWLIHCHLKQYWGMCLLQDDAYLQGL